MPGTVLAIAVYLGFANYWQGHHKSMWCQLLEAHNSPSLHKR